MKRVLVYTWEAAVFAFAPRSITQVVAPLALAYSSIDFVPHRLLVLPMISLASAGLLQNMAKPGAPDIQEIAELRKRYDTEQVSPLST